MWVSKDTEATQLPIVNEFCVHTEWNIINDKNKKEAWPLEKHSPKRCC